MCVETSLLRRHFLFVNQALRSQIAEGFRRSTSLVADRLEDARGAATIRAAAALLEDQHLDESPEILEDARCVLLMEAIDRAVWSGGNWDSTAARRTLYGLRSSPPFGTGAKLRTAAGRMLVEGIGSQPIRDNPMFVKLVAEAAVERRKSVEAAIEESERLFKGAELVELRLVDLEPGMRVAKPVLSWDGKVVLPSNTVLDADLIWRLWETSALRPFRQPMSVVIPAARRR